jgi:amino-acid N-acetyltransferase
MRPAHCPIACELQPPVVLRQAIAADQSTLYALMKHERLDAAEAGWPQFIVAADGFGIVGAAQLRRHCDGSSEVASLVVLPPMRGQGIAARLLDALLAARNAPVHLVAQRTHATYFERWGFRGIQPWRAPGAVRRRWLVGQLAELGRIAGLTGCFGLHRPQRLVILERPSRTATPAA